MSSGKKYTYEEVKAYFFEHGCELLDQEYKNARTKLSYKCVCGTKSTIVFDSFRRGNRCRNCGNQKARNKQRFSEEYVQKYFRSQGCELLEPYTGNLIPMKYRCSCGNVSKITWNNFKTKGRRCWECGIKRRSGENHYEWIHDRSEAKLRHDFRQRCYKALAWSLRLTGKIKKERTEILLGYSPDQLREHVTSHPNWDTVKDVDWHLDHIYPIKAFVDFGISDLKIINALDNLRPILREDNQLKHAKYDVDEFRIWLKNKGICI